MRLGEAGGYLLYFYRRYNWRVCDIESIGILIGKFDAFTFFWNFGNEVK